MRNKRKKQDIKSIQEYLEKEVRKKVSHNNHVPYWINMSLSGYFKKGLQNEL